eukprot:PhM_4_TR1327/c5_g1_i1/m.101138
MPSFTASCDKESAEVPLSSSASTLTRPRASSRPCGSWIETVSPLANSPSTRSMCSGCTVEPPLRTKSSTSASSLRWMRPLTRRARPSQRLCVHKSTSMPGMVVPTSSSTARRRTSSSRASAMTVVTPAAAARRADSILECMPPRPREPAEPHMARSSGVTTGTRLSSLASGLPRGSRSYTPGTSVRSTRCLASICDATRADSWSLSPTVRSAFEMGSFSFMMGTMPHARMARSVSMRLAWRSRLEKSSCVRRSCAMLTPWAANASSHLAIRPIWPMAGRAWRSPRAAGFSAKPRMFMPSAAAPEDTMTGVSPRSSRSLTT